MTKVLVIEDNLEIRENISEILELQGFAVLKAENGEQGLRVAREAQPDIILCDIMMPGVNGYDVLNKLKTDRTTSSIPFVYVTASAEKSEVRIGMELGANGYVRKPFDTAELLQTIAVCLAQSAR